VRVDPTLLKTNAARAGLGGLQGGVNPYWPWIQSSKIVVLGRGRAVGEDSRIAGITENGRIARHCPHQGENCGGNQQQRQNRSKRLHAEIHPLDKNRGEADIPGPARE
jgi:hypothetical protein